MLEYFDENVEINLKLLFEHPKNEMFRIDFVNRLGNELIESERFAELMQEKGLVKLEPKEKFRCDLTEFGYKVAENGGWIKYLREKEHSEQQHLDKQISKDKLEREVTILQKDNLEYNKTIREQQERIRNLEEQIKLISLLKLYWWLIPICIALGVFLAKVWYLIMS